MELPMQQLRLVYPQKANFEKAVSYSHIKAEFMRLRDWMHEVILKINSHKFFLMVKTWIKKLEHFEVLAVQGCVELGMKMVRLLKRIVTTLYFEY